MNTKKLTAIICSAALSVSAFAAFGGCGNKECEHVVNSWTTSVGKAATCVQNGEEYGNCINCGEVVVREVPANPADLACHSYGEWAVQKPEGDSAGSARKTCTLCGDGVENHTHEVSLPALSNEGGYTSVQKSEATVIADGKYTYTLNDETGTVSFDVIKPMKTTIDCVADAVLLGSSKGMLIRKTEAHILDQSLYSDYMRGDLTGREVTAQFGGVYGGDINDYVHILDEGNKIDDWYSYDGTYREEQTAGGETVQVKNVFGVRTSDRTLTGDLKTEVLPNADLSDMNGFKFALSLSGIDTGLEGAEGLISSLYELAISAKNLTAATAEAGDILNFKEKMPSQNNGYYGFSFDSVGHTLYTEIKVDFKISEVGENRGAISEVNVEELAYERDKYDFEEGYILNGEGEHIPEPDGKGETPHFAGFIKLTQTFKASGDGITGNENIYKAGDLYVSDFVVKYDGSELKSDVAVSIPAAATVSFKISDVVLKNGTNTDKSALAYDPVEVHWTNPNTGIDVTLGNYYDTMAGINLFGYFDDDNLEVVMGCRMMGEVVITLKTLSGNCSKTIKLNVQPQVPAETDLRVNYYSYSDASGIEEYVWMEYDNGDEINVVTGQPAVFKLSASGESASYADVSFTYELDAASSAVSFTDVAAGSPEAAQYDGQAVIFTASAAGTYKLWFETANPDKNGEYPSKFIKVKVAQATPAEDFFQNGAKYTGTVSTGDKEETLMLEITNDSNALQGTVKITVGERFTVFDYTLNQTDGKATLTYKEGYQNSNGTTDYALAVNAANKLTITHPDGHFDIETDEQGNPVKDGNGMLVTKPAYETKVLTALSNG